jgi:hypothetical protein
MIFWGSSGTIIPTPNMNKNTDRFNPMMDIRFSMIIPPVVYMPPTLAQKKCRTNAQLRLLPEQKSRGPNFMMPRDYLTADQLLQGGGGGRIS